MLSASFSEIDHGLSLVPRSGDVDDDPFTENGVLDVVADAQSQFIGQ